MTEQQEIDVIIDKARCVSNESGASDWCFHRAFDCHYHRGGAPIARTTIKNWMRLLATDCDAYGTRMGMRRFGRGS